ncbi:hypothetical protein BT96DRAFT_1670 [Gymnopus androsaceus JB14]|uniref:Uncharacterized protein n=1 Tax=Gymnopus androsaceus JB14 TaxID=1447944 RepID=A0A6A4IKP6_9AGAR|nr:hypothetical protein BT96DRAFT_1670 [Gymnopus androsaceus JB14]
MATAISTTAPSMLSHPSPSASSFSSHSDESRVVRFDNECVLIPDLQRIKRPILITKSYSLPIWKRRSEEQLAEEAPALKVAFPTLNFKAKPARSSSRGREPTSPLSPCLVHRSPSSSRIESVSPRKLERRPSLPNSPPLDVLGKPLVTIPLRSCCTDCVTITEECLKEGEAWVEKFTRGARRRRNSSADSDCGFTPVASTHHGHKDVAVIRLGSSASITVDEVDRRRRSREIEPDSSTGTSSSPINIPTAHSAIIEEDEDQLFPLPSPRRSPNSSPANSASPSPNSSSYHLSQPVSNESAKIPEEGILAKSIMRKGRCEKGFLTAEAAPGPLLPSESVCISSEDDALPSPVESPDALSSPSTAVVDSPSPVSSDPPLTPVSPRR